MTLLHPYESAEASCRRRKKVSTAAKWQAVWADSRWYGPAMMSNGRDSLFKGILTPEPHNKKVVVFVRATFLSKRCLNNRFGCMYTCEFVEALRCCIRV